MTPDQYTIWGSLLGALTVWVTVKGYSFYQTHTLITCAELHQLRFDVQSKELQIEELQRQLDTIRAPKDGRGKPSNAGQFELGLKTETPKTQRFGPMSVTIEGKEHQVFMVWYAGERTKYLDEGLVLVRRNGIEKWLAPDDVHPRDVKLQPWWYVDERGRQVYCKEVTLRDNKKKTVWYFYHRPKKGK